MRVLYLSYDGLTDPLGQSQILPYLLSLKQLEHQIDIVSFEKAEVFQRSGDAIQQLCNEAGLGYYPQQYHKNPPVLSTLFDVWRMKNTAAKLHGRTDYQIVHCRSYISSLVGEWMKQKFGTRFIFDMRGFYADERVDGGIWPQKNWLFRKVYHYFKRKERDFITNSDHTISLTHNGAEEILKWNLLPDSSQLTVIPCCTDTDHFDPAKVDSQKTAQLKHDLQIKNHWPIIGYVGSIGTWYLLDDILRYFSLLLKQYPKALMLFLTFDNQEKIFDSAKQHDIDSESIRVRGVKREELPSYLALFDWSVFFIQPAFSKKASSPTKQGELMSMGIPVVCNADVGDTAEIVEKYRSGLSVKNTSDEQLKHAVAQSPLLLEMDKSQIIYGAKEYFSLQNGVAKYHQIYVEVMQ